MKNTIVLMLLFMVALIAISSAQLVVKKEIIGSRNGVYRVRVAYKLASNAPVTEVRSFSFTTKKRGTTKKKQKKKRESLSLTRTPFFVFFPPSKYTRIHTQIHNTHTRFFSCPFLFVSHTKSCTGQDQGFGP